MTDSGKTTDPTANSVADGFDEPISEQLADLGKGIWWLVLLRGVLAIAFGIIAISAPAVALTAIAIVFGAFALVDGIFLAVHAVRVRNSIAAWGWLLAQGIVSALAGLAALALPTFAGALGGLFVLWTIVIWNIIQGAMGIRSASGATSGQSRTWGIIAGVLSVLFGILLAIFILVSPGATLLSLIWVAGIWAVIGGIVLIVTAIQIRVKVSGARDTATV